MPDAITFIVEFDPVEHYTAHAKGHSIFTQADTLHELHGNMREAVACYFDDGENRAIWVERFYPSSPTTEAIRAAERGELTTVGSLDELFEDLHADD